jgi:DegV family protein with EDD domain
MVQVIADSCASIPDKLVKQLDVQIVPYYIHRGVETLLDLADVKRQEFFEWMAKADHVPQTANPGPGDYLTAFRQAAAKTQEIVTIHMTSKGSGAYQSALAAKEMARETLPELKIKVVDTLQVAMVHGWAALEAARAALDGASLEQVAHRARQVASKGMMIQTADTLRYLYLGGRIGKAQHLAGSLLRIKPLIGMDDGVIVALGQARSRAKAYRGMVNLMQQRLAPGDRIKAAFTHVAADQEARRLCDLIQQNFDCEETLIAELSPALGVHTGPGTVGICFYVSTPA